ncbi:nitroreductase family protein [Mucilaginibacter xinganensis]|uniref:Nitroreductase n=1 Tax=Mucilaginibacter xinganensis TaxID=1234841 RepID=A0A223NXX5_9SPHI|nr:nitroreductase [Mucilaginibacter xinganensis]ASU34554.1 Nitroreductase [Mucilaginibacter xinganensis]
MDNNFSEIASVIKNRRTIKSQAMNGNKIPNGHIAAILELANWAPTHGCTEPWRFIVYENPSDFCRQHAEIYKQNSLGDNFVPAVYENLARQGDKASHIIVAVMKRGDLPKIPQFEEIAAASCAIQNMLLGATSLNIASFWSTGGMALKPALKEYLGYGEHDLVMGILYFGYADTYPEGKRNSEIEKKNSWVK